MFTESLHTCGGCVELGETVKDIRYSAALPSWLHNSFTQHIDYAM